jgi:hypothetical protein
MTIPAYTANPPESRSEAHRRLSQDSFPAVEAARVADDVNCQVNVVGDKPCPAPRLRGTACSHKATTE